MSNLNSFSLCVLKPTFIFVKFYIQNH
jgi:hypothetical protein